MHTLSTRITKMLNIKYPIIGAPMFLVSNESMVIAISEAGGIGTFPALNYRPLEEYKKALSLIKSQTKKPIGVNVIVGQGNPRRHDDLKYALDAGVELFVTSLGSPKEVIQDAHKNGAKVFCDVTNLEHAKKVQDMGADAVVGVYAGAGGHAGPISPMSLIPWLKNELSLPIIAAGGITNGATMAAAFCLGAEAVHVGTRFIASTEASVPLDYKQAIIDSNPEQVILSDRISGTPCNFIKTDYFHKSQQMPLFIKLFKKYTWSKKYVQTLVYFLGMKSLADSLQTDHRKKVWCAGQSVGIINEIKPCQEIINDMVREYFETLKTLPQ